MTVERYEQPTIGEALDLPLWDRATLDASDDWRVIAVDRHEHCAAAWLFCIQANGDAWWEALVGWRCSADTWHEASGGSWGEGWSTPWRPELERSQLLQRWDRAGTTARHDCNDDDWLSLSVCCGFLAPSVRAVGVRDRFTERAVPVSSPLGAFAVVAWGEDREIDLWPIS